MGKAFEDEFTELQTDMIAICLEYVDDRAEKVFVYGSREGKTTTSNFFYQIHGQVVRKHKLNEALQIGDEPYDVSPDRQGEVLRIMNQDIQKIEKLCRRYKREMPTEMKLIYDVRTNHVEANYRYDNVYSDDLKKSPDAVFADWFAEEAVKAKHP